LGFIQFYAGKAHADPVEEQDEQVEHEPGRAGNICGEQCRGDDGERNESHSRESRGAQAVLGDPDATAARTPLDEGTVGEVPREGGSD
jgi:hypothetical protein